MPWSASPASLGLFSALTPAEQDLLEDVTRSNRKRKPVKQGLVSRLEKAERMRRSMRTIHNHQLNLLNKKSTNFKELRVTRVEIVSCIVSLHCSDESGENRVVLINQEFCKELVEPGYKVRIQPPWTELKLKGRDFLTGIMELEIIETCDTPRTPAVPVTEYGDGSGARVKPDFAQTNGVQHIDVLCQCQKVEGEGRFCEDPTVYQNLLQYDRTRRVRPKERRETIEYQPPAPVPGRYNFLQIGVSELVNCSKKNTISRV